MTYDYEHFEYTQIPLLYSLDCTNCHNFFFFYCDVYRISEEKENSFNVLMS